MILFLVLLLGFGAGVLVTLGLLRQRRDSAQETGNPSQEPAPSQELTAPDANVEPADSLGAKLYKLSIPLEMFGDSTAHPNQLAEKAEFQQASYQHRRHHVARARQHQGIATFAVDGGCR